MKKYEYDCYYEERLMYIMNKINEAAEFGWKLHTILIDKDKLYPYRVVLEREVKDD